jgi:hypothetical protein
MNSQEKPTQPKSGMKILTDFSLWNLLLKNSVPAGHKKLTKAEAFYDLLNRQKLAVLYDQDVLPGNFQILTENRNWHHQAVKKFLSELQVIGAIDIDLSANRMVIRGANVIFTSPYPVDGSQNIQGANPFPTGVPP